MFFYVFFFFFSSRRRHTRCSRDWSSDVCSSDLASRNLCLEGVRLVQTGDTTRAETLLLARLASNPDDPCALTNLGNLARLRGEWSQAKVLYRMAWKRDTSDAGILLNYAVVLHELKDPAADSLYRRA